MQFTDLTWHYNTYAHMAVMGRCRYAALVEQTDLQVRPILRFAIIHLAAAAAKVMSSARPERNSYIG